MNHEVDVEEGLSPDNSACEGFFGRLKVELFCGRSWSGWSVDDFMGAVDRYIHWCNERRIKESLGGDEPAAVQAVAQSSGISALVRKSVSIPKPKNQSCKTQSART